MESSNLDVILKDYGLKQQLKSIIWYGKLLAETSLASTFPTDVARWRTEDNSIAIKKWQDQDPGEGCDVQSWLSIWHFHQPDLKEMYGISYAVLTAGLTLATAELIL